ncbi:MAG: hypothetical protein AB9866_29345 [Syntrophobacteraceae bacterium]
MKDYRNTVHGTFHNVLILLMAFILASCASFGSGSPEKKEKELNASVEAFNSAFRWEDYKGASRFVDIAKKELFWEEVDKFKGKIRLLDFQIREVDQNEKATLGTAILYIQFYRTDAPTLQSATFTQRWYFSEKDKGWKLAQSGYSAITKERPGI